MLVFFSNQRICILAFLLLSVFFSDLACEKPDAVAVQREAVRMRRLRAAYRYVQEVLAPPQAVVEDAWSLKHRCLQAVRMLGITGLSLIGGEAFMFILHRLPWVKNTINTVESRIKDCHNCISVAANMSRYRTQLREYFLGKDRVALAAGVDATVIPNFQDYMLSYLEKKTQIDDILGWIKKGAITIIFLGLCRYFPSNGEATWTYKGILEKAISEWPEHQYFFPKELKPRFSLLYDAYIARKKTLVMTEEDAQRFIEWTCLEVMDMLVAL